MPTYMINSLKGTKIHFESRMIIPDHCTTMQEDFLLTVSFINFATDSNLHTIAIEFEAVLPTGREILGHKTENQPS
jgi:hypothetical protein